MWYSVIVLFVVLYTFYSPEQTKILHLSSAIGNKREKIVMSLRLTGLRGLAL